MIRLSVSPLTVVFASLLTSLLAGAVARGQNATVGLFNPPGSFWSVQKGTFGNSSANGSVTGQITLNDAQNNPIPWGTGVIMGSSAGSVTISGANSDNFVTAFNSGGFAKLAISDDPTGGTITPENSEAAATLVPFSGGWTSANMNGLTVQSGNTTGITIANPSTGNYTINGLPSTNEGLVMAFAQGDAAGATTDNLLSTKYDGGGQWTITSYDNDGTTLENLGDWSWIHLPWESQGLYTGSIAQNGTITAGNALMQGLLGTSSASWNNGDLDLQIGNGSLVNTDDYALFLVGDGSVFEGTDNILGWSALNATTFRVTAIDSPAQGAADGPLHFVAMPYTGAIVVPEPSGLGLAAVATCASVAFWRRRRTSSAA